MNLKFALRNFRKRPYLNLIKVVGLSLALSGILLIALYLKNELTYDRFHQKSDRIYRFTLSNRIAGQHYARVYRPAYIPDFAGSTPDIENYVRLIPVRGGVLKHGDNFVNIRQGFQCDSTFFKVFDARWISGNPAEVLNAPGAMVVTESFAQRVFGETNPIGQTLVRPAGQYYQNEDQYTVKGIIKDFPQNSHFHPDFLVSRSNKQKFYSWAWTYLLLRGNTEPEEIEEEFKGFFTSRFSQEAAEKMDVYLQNISDIHLHSHKLREIEPNSNVSVVYTFFIAAAILLLIALINYSNLNLGMAGFSERYLFVSKTFGSSARKHLKYFFVESLVVLAASLVLSFIIVVLAHQAIRNHFGLDLFAGNLVWIGSIVFLFSVLVVVFGVLPVAGFAVRSLRSFTGNRNETLLKNKGLSKPLLVLQYTVSIALIVAVIVIYQQTTFAYRNGMGATQDNLICMERVHSQVQNRFELFKSELLKYPSIESVSAMMENPGGEINDRMQFTMEGFQADEQDNLSDWITVLPCDYSFASIFNLNFLAGRNFSQTNKEQEGSGEYILNESAMRKLHYREPSAMVGKPFKLNFSHGPIDIPQGKIIGVVEDFHFSSLKRQIQPMVMFKREALWLMNFIISFQPDGKQEALSAVQEVWTRLFPEYPLEYQYVTSMYEEVYRAEFTQARLLLLFTILALFICSMGLLGMSLLLTRRREKEIGIRKVNGARGSQIVRMLNWQLLRWIVFAVFLAIPLAFYSMNRWLENFAYKINPSWWIFVLAALSALAISLLTVTINSRRAASKNPVNVLRYE
jgi:putative ABC transport system permease protein